MAFSWTGATTALASVVRNENNRWSPGTGAALVPRTPFHGRQMPAKKNSGRSTISANQVGTALPLRWSYSQKLVTGTRQRLPACNHGRQ